MGFFDVFRTKKKFLEPGEVDGERIGCYLLGIPGDGERENSFHSHAANKEKLIEDCKKLIEDSYVMISRCSIEDDESDEEVVRLRSLELENMKSKSLKYLEEFYINVEERIDNHFMNKDSSIPFISIMGTNFFLLRGIRDRERENNE